MCVWGGGGGEGGGFGKSGRYFGGSLSKLSIFWGLSKFSFFFFFFFFFFVGGVGLGYCKNRG